jgi:hypothetical protein
MGARENVQHCLRSNDSPTIGRTDSCWDMEINLEMLKLKDDYTSSLTLRTDLQCKYKISRTWMKADEAKERVYE